MPEPSHIYLLPEYVNESNLRQDTHEQTHTSTVEYFRPPFLIKISEVNSLVESKYSLNLKAAKYVIESNTTEVKEKAIHHHPQGHPWKHIQFTLQAANEKIRIRLESLDEEDFKRCTKGFLFISQKVIAYEKEKNKIQDDLQNYFFNGKIKTLKSESLFLLDKIKLASTSNGILDDKDKPLNDNQIEKLKVEKHLLPFFDWKM